jgi:hypothetical protein
MLPDGSLNRIDPLLLKQKLTEMLISENYDALKIVDLSEVLVLDTDCLRIITDTEGVPIVSGSFQDALTTSSQFIPMY